MFLAYLQKENKERFLKICVYAALSNGIFAEEEKETLEAYCREMNVDVHIPPTQETFEELIQEISANSDSKEKNIFLLETLALIRSDGVYDEKEQSFMKSLTKGLNLSESVLEKFITILDKYNDIGRELYVAISE